MRFFVHRQEMTEENALAPLPRKVGQQHSRLLLGQGLSRLIGDNRGDRLQGPHRFLGRDAEDEQSETLRRTRFRLAEGRE